MRINLASTRLAFVLIAVLVLFLILSAVIPQRDISEDQILDWQEYLGDNYAFIDKLGLDRIYYTPTFFVVLGLLAVNLLFGNIKRFRLVYRTERTLLRVRHVGSILFHLSLLLIMTSIILNFLYKYHGVLAMTEGQTLTDVPEAYHREFKGPLYADLEGRFAVTLDEIITSDSYTFEPGSKAKVSIATGDGLPITTEVSTNHPFESGELEFHYGLKSGYSPELQLIDSGGNDLFRSFVRLASRKIDGRVMHRDLAFVHAEEIQMEVDVLEGDDPTTVSYAVQIQQDTAMLYEGTMAMTDTVQFDGYEFTIPRLRRWCYIDVVKSPYLNLVFLGFWLALSGLVVSFVPRLNWLGRT